jgi:hypothetical protein
MKSQAIECEEMSFWQMIFSQSKANGAQYSGETLPICCWNWPLDTYLQRRRSLRQSPNFLAAKSERTEIAALSGFETAR